MLSRFLFILMSCVFCHIVDDYYLQGCLANMKQKSWWEGMFRDDRDRRLYGHDYIMALACHAMSWSFMIMVPLMVLAPHRHLFYVTVWIWNSILHAAADNAKANWKCINLVEDQLLHFVQILGTVAMWL